MLIHSISIAKKELGDYFSSLAAFLFLGIFLVATYIIFFWVEAFFARNLADMRAFFNWVPVLLIFLVSVLTMSSWSEERRLGTIELQITSAVSINSYILGKFFAVMCLICISLILTSPLALTVNALGDLDWGPVFGGYIAALFLAAAYTAIGLWASAQSDNQIVGLILSVTISAALYIIGTSTFTQLFTYEIAEWLRSLATGARFESITRGVLDLRDIFYYLSIVAVFLILSRLKIDSLRNVGHRHNLAEVKEYRYFALFLIVLLIFNITLNTFKQLRIDFTEGKIYTLSDATKNYLEGLDEPLLIRGYFSSTTHPLLSPLVPRMRDILNEYALAGGGNVRIEMIDPIDQASFEEEAGTKYGIRPVSFHTESKYQASVINTYFNVLVEYGDQYDVLNYKELVELKSSSTGRHEVELKNPEYQITRTIKSVVSKEDLQVTSLSDIDEAIILSAYVSSEESLPLEYVDNYKRILDVSSALKLESNENFEIIPTNPDGDQLTSAYLSEELKFKPRINNATQAPFWFHFTLTNGKSTIPISFDLDAVDISEKQIKTRILSAYKRLLPESIKTVAILRPLPTPGPAGVSASPGIPKRFSILRNYLSNSVKVIDVDLRSGQVNEDIGLLLVLAPRYLAPIQINAIDQFLQRGGTVVVSSSSIDVAISHFTEVYDVSSGLEGWLNQIGINFNKSLVMDMRHGKYSLPVSRQVGAINVRETNIVDYPYIIDVREKGLNSESIISDKLGQIFVPWASAIDVLSNLEDNVQVTTLLESSDNSWTSDHHDVIPDFQLYPDIGFNQPDKFSGTQVLAMMLEGQFNTSQVSADESARLIVIGSSMIFTDNFLDEMSQVLRTEYRRPMQFIQNIVDWSLQDQNLLQVLRKHTQFTRTLNVVSDKDKTFWEYLNYILGIIGLVIIGGVNWLVRLSSNKYNQTILAKVK